MASTPPPTTAPVHSASMLLMGSTTDLGALRTHNVVQQRQAQVVDATRRLLQSEVLVNMLQEAGVELPSMEDVEMGKRRAAAQPHRGDWRSALNRNPAMTAPSGMPEASDTGDGAVPVTPENAPPSTGATPQAAPGASPPRTPRKPEARGGWRQHVNRGGNGEVFEKNPVVRRLKKLRHKVLYGKVGEKAYARYKATLRANLTWRDILRPNLSHAKRGGHNQPGFSKWLDSAITEEQRRAVRDEAARTIQAAWRNFRKYRTDSIMRHVRDFEIGKYGWSDDDSVATDELPDWWGDSDESSSEEDEENGKKKKKLKKKGTLKRSDSTVKRRTALAAVAGAMDEANMGDAVTEGAAKRKKKKKKKGGGKEGGAEGEDGGGGEGEEGGEEGEGEEGGEGGGEDGGEGGDGGAIKKKKSRRKIKSAVKREGEEGGDDDAGGEGEEGKEGGGETSTLKKSKSIRRKSSRRLASGALSAEEMAMLEAELQGEDHGGGGDGDGDAVVEAERGVSEPIMDAATAAAVAAAAKLAAAAEAAAAAEVEKASQPSPPPPPTQSPPPQPPSVQKSPATSPTPDEQKPAGAQPAQKGKKKGKKGSKARGAKSAAAKQGEGQDGEGESESPGLSPEPSAGGLSTGKPASKSPVPDPEAPPAEPPAAPSPGPKSTSSPTAHPSPSTAPARSTPSPSLGGPLSASASTASVGMPLVPKLPLGKGAQGGGRDRSGRKGGDASSAGEEGDDDEGSDDDGRSGEDGQARKRNKKKKKKRASGAGGSRPSRAFVTEVPDWSKVGHSAALFDVKTDAAARAALLARMARDAGPDWRPTGPVAEWYKMSQYIYDGADPDKRAEAMAKVAAAVAAAGQPLWRPAGAASTQVHYMSRSLYDGADPDKRAEALTKVVSSPNNPLWRPPGVGPGIGGRPKYNGGPYDGDTPKDTPRSEASSSNQPPWRPPGVPRVEYYNYYNSTGSSASESSSGKEDDAVVEGEEELTSEERAARREERRAARRAARASARVSGGEGSGSDMGNRLNGRQPWRFTYTVDGDMAVPSNEPAQVRYDNIVRDDKGAPVPWKYTVIAEQNSTVPYNIWGPYVEPGSAGNKPQRSESMLALATRKLAEASGAGGLGPRSRSGSLQPTPRGEPSASGSAGPSTSAPSTSSAAAPPPTEPPPAKAAASAPPVAPAAPAAATPPAAQAPLPASTASTPSAPVRQPAAPPAPTTAKPAAAAGPAPSPFTAAVEVAATATAAAPLTAIPSAADTEPTSMAEPSMYDSTEQPSQLYGRSSRSRSPSPSQSPAPQAASRSRATKQELLRRGMSMPQLNLQMPGARRSSVNTAVIPSHIVLAPEPAAAAAAQAEALAALMSVSTCDSSAALRGLPYELSVMGRSAIAGSGVGAAGGGGDSSDGVSAGGESLDDEATPRRQHPHYHNRGRRSPGAADVKPPSHVEGVDAVSAVEDGGAAAAAVGTTSVMAEGGPLLAEPSATHAAGGLRQPSREVSRNALLQHLVAEPSQQSQSQSQSQQPQLSERSRTEAEMLWEGFAAEASAATAPPVGEASAGASPWMFSRLYGNTSSSAVYTSDGGGVPYAMSRRRRSNVGRRSYERPSGDGGGAVGPQRDAPRLYPPALSAAAAANPPKRVCSARRRGAFTTAGIQPYPIDPALLRSLPAHLIAQAGRARSAPGSPRGGLGAGTDEHQALLAAAAGAVAAAGEASGASTGLGLEASSYGAYGSAASVGAQAGAGTAAPPPPPKLMNTREDLPPLPAILQDPRAQDYLCSQGTRMVVHRRLAAKGTVQPDPRSMCELLFLGRCVRQQRDEQFVSGTMAASGTAAAAAAGAPVTSGTTAAAATAASGAATNAQLAISPRRRAAAAALAEAHSRAQIKLSASHPMVRMYNMAGIEPSPHGHFTWSRAGEPYGTLGPSDVAAMAAAAAAAGLPAPLVAWEEAEPDATGAGVGWGGGPDTAYGRPVSSHMSFQQLAAQQQAPEGLFQPHYGPTQPQIQGQGQGLPPVRTHSLPPLTHGSSFSSGLQPPPLPPLSAEMLLRRSTPPSSTPASAAGGLGVGVTVSSRLSYTHYTISPAVPMAAASAAASAGEADAHPGEAGLASVGDASEAVAALARSGSLRGEGVGADGAPAGGRQVGSGRRQLQPPQAGTVLLARSSSSRGSSREGSGGAHRASWGNMREEAAEGAAEGGQGGLMAVGGDGLAGDAADAWTVLPPIAAQQQQQTASQPAVPVVPPLQLQQTLQLQQQQQQPTMPFQQFQFQAQPHTYLSPTLGGSRQQHQQQQHRASTSQSTRLSTAPAAGTSASASLPGRVLGGGGGSRLPAVGQRGGTAPAAHGGEAEGLGGSKARNPRGQLRIGRAPLGPPLAARVPERPPVPSK